MSRSERETFEPRFGMDLGRVRIHEGKRADASARSLGARAYTYGDHVVLRSGIATDQGEGRWLLAHELGGHDHQQGHVCELCVHANAHQAVLPATKLVMPQDHGHAPYLGTNQTQDLPFIAERGQPIRAPPALLLT